MTIGGAMLLIAVGAILKWAVTAQVSWIDIQTAGTVLFVVGLVGLAVSLLYTFWLADRSRARVDDRTEVMREPPRRY
jgi:site-specific recombinase